MKQCKYCYLLPNGDIPEDTKDIIDKKFASGCYSVRIGNTGGDFGILIQDTRSFKLLIDKPLKFKYCPMCGKEL